MASITGSSTVIILKLGSTFATAVAGGAGDQITVDSLNHDTNPTELRVNPIGSGLDMDQESETGNTSPTVQFDKVCGYDDAANVAEALFWGTATSTLQGASARCHSMTYNATRFTKFITAAFHGHSAGTYEYVSCTPRTFTVTAQNPKDYVRMSMELLANQRVINSSTNTTATLATATLANSKRVVCKASDEFLINAQAGGALTTVTDRIAITSFVAEYTYDIQHVYEIKGSSGNAIPVANGSPPLTVTLTITLRNQSDFAWFTAQDAGTEYKANLTITGDVIAGSISYQVVRYFPRLKIIQDPQYDLTTVAENPLTVVFKGLVASSVPTGMISVYPHTTLINTKVANYLTAA